MGGERTRTDLGGVTNIKVFLSYIVIIKDDVKIQYLINWQLSGNSARQQVAATTGLELWFVTSSPHTYALIRSWERINYLNKLEPSIFTARVIKKEKIFLYTDLNLSNLIILEVEEFLVSGLIWREWKPSHCKISMIIFKTWLKLN